MVVDGQALEHLLHVDSLEHVVESTSLALLRAALERDALQIWTIPRKIRVERQQRVDQRLQQRVDQLTRYM